MRAVIAVISDLSTDMRVQKHAEILKEMGYSVKLVGRHCGRTPLLLQDGIKAIRIRIPFRKGPLMYLFFNAALLVHLLIRRADLYLSNDLDTLLPSRIASLLCGKPLVYDAHEYFTGQYGLPERRVKYSIWKGLEKRLLPGMKNMMAHEVGHRFFYHLYPNIRKPVRPNWLDEGLATYAGMEASGWGATGYGFNAIVEAVKTSKPLWTALANLDRLQESAESLELFYGTAATVIYHICTSYSEQALKQLLTEYNGSADLPQAIQKTLGISYAEFEEKWASLVQDIARHANDGTQFYELLQKSKA